jgi:hypothetical protein
MQSIILPLVLYGCEAWSLTLTEVYRLRAFENRVLRRIFELKKDEIIGGWRELHSNEFRNVYSSPHIIRMMKSRRMRWARMGEKRIAHSVVDRKTRRNETTRKT